MENCDNDGDLDVYVTNGGTANTANKLYRNDGSGVFTDVTSTAGVGESAVTPALRANCSVVPGEPWRDLQYVQLLRGAAELQRRSHPK